MFLHQLARVQAQVIRRLQVRVRVRQSLPLQVLAQQKHLQLVLAQVRRQNHCLQTISNVHMQV